MNDSIGFLHDYFLFLDGGESLDLIILQLSCTAPKVSSIDQCRD